MRYQPRALPIVLDGQYVSNLSSFLLFSTLVRLLTIPPELKDEKIAQNEL